MTTDRQPASASGRGAESRQSLQRNLLLPAGLVLAAMLILSFAAFYRILRAGDLRSLDEKADSVADMAARSMAEGIEFNDKDVLQPMVDGIAEDPTVVRIITFDASGAEIVSHARRVGPGEETIVQQRDVLSKDGRRVGGLRLEYTRTQALAEVRRATAWYGILASLAFLAGLAVLYHIIGRVVRPIVALTEATSRIVSQGDLTQRVTISSRDEIGQLAAAFNKMLDRLREIPLALRGSVEDLDISVKRLTDLAHAQTSAVQRQASGLAEASATTAEIKQTSGVAATKAETVLQVATKAEEFGGAGQTAVEGSIQGLQDIRSQIESIVGRIAELSERTMQVGEIIETVKDLADQSNVLALNAAIEAAKAGEFGRGFGIVAREIRSLADQSIQSTARIREILSEIQTAIRSTAAITEQGKRRMEQSMDQIRSSGENLRDMAAIVRESSQAARQIAASVSQQNAGIAQISGAIGSLDATMEETAAAIRGVEEAVSNVKSVSARMSDIVGGFRTS